MKKKLVVPYDFTAVADNALRHALVTAKVVDAEVHTLHVLTKKEVLKKTKIRLDEATEKAKRLSETTDVSLVNHVRIGNIFEDIADFAAEISAELIFMGTHGASGWQHVTGSHALKVVTDSAAPFVIVQKAEIKPSGYDDIVVPLDLHKETKQKLTLVANMAQYFDSKVYVVIPDESDAFSRNTVKANILFANKFFNERNIAIATTLAPAAGFDKEVVKHAIKVNADLIAIMNLQKHQLLGLFGSTHEQYMITNEAQIPVLIINPIDATNAYQTIFT